MVTITHAFVSGIADSPTAAAAGEVLPSHWNASHVITGLSNRTVLTALNTDFYVSSTGNDSHGGTNSTTDAWLTLDHAMTVLSTQYDFGGNQATVHIGAGSFAGCQILPIVGGGDIYFVGAGSTLTTITSSTSILGACFGNFLPIGAEIWINNLKCAPTTNNSLACSIIAFSPASYFIADPNGIALTDMAFVGNVHAQACIYMFAPGAYFTDEFAGGTITITGSHGSFVLSEQGGGSVFLGNTYVLSGTPTFSTGFLQCNMESTIFFTGPTSGSFTGRGFIVSQNAVILGGSSEAVTFPGASQAGQRFSGGTFVDQSSGQIGTTWMDKWISPTTAGTAMQLDATNQALTITSIANPAASVSALNVVGASNAQNNSPVASFSETWNNASTTYSGLVLNVTPTAFHAGSKILDVQVSGTTTFRIDPAGNPDVIVGSTYNYDGAVFGYIIKNASGNNVFLGGAGNFTVTGDRNFGEGPECLISLTSGTRNMGMGAQSLKATTTGQVNCAVGQGALQANTTGSNNMAVGQGALGANIDGTDNVAIGSAAGASSQHDIQYVAIGQNALNALNGGNQNVAVGQGCLQSLTGGSSNTIIGTQAGSAYTGTESGNTIIGLLAGTAAENFVIRIGAGTNQRAVCDNTTGSWHFVAGVYIGETTDILHATSAMTNNAGALTGTLTNSPVTGNPTKWLAFDDAGTTRYIPAW